MILRCIAAGATGGSGGGPLGTILGAIGGLIVGAVGTAICKDINENERQTKTQSVIRVLENRLREVEHELRHTKSLSLDYIEKLRRERDRLREELRQAREDMGR